MKIMLTGASGFLGRKIAQLAVEKGYDVYSVYNEHVVNIGTPIKLDLTDREKLLKTISERRPNAIIHTAAYRDVEGCEINRDLAWRVNAEVTKDLATVSASVNAHLTYVSTDYVFNGEKGFYAEDDKPDPVNYYGYTKLRGEEFVRENAEEWCIARTSLIYGWGSRPNFPTWLLSNLNQRKEVKILTDQYLSPTLDKNLAEMLIEIAEGRIAGLLHTAGATRASRYEFALKLTEVFDLNTDLIKPVEMDEMPWRAKRPRDSSLSVSKASNLLSTKPLKLDHTLEIMRRENGC